MLSAEIEQHQRMLEALLLSPQTYPTGRFQSRGIVLCAGGDRYFPCAWVCIRMLRHLGCQLPIELWHRGPTELNAEMDALVAPWGVRCVDAYAMARAQPVRRLDGWELKPYAIMQSSFAEVLYLDADNVPVRDPTFLFETPAYQAAGALFWPDRYMGEGDGHAWLRRETWDICGVLYRNEPEIEAGQLLIDKRRCWLPLQIAMHLNEYSDFYYAYFYGDKDTFHLAWRRARQEYALVPHRPGTLLVDIVLVQFDHAGQPLFQHRNRAKWALAGANRRIPGFRFEAECFEFLHELRGSWSGQARRLPDDFSSQEQAAYAELCRAKRFRYIRVGYEQRVIEFRPDLTIGLGAAEMEIGWMVEEVQDGTVVLSIRNSGGPTCFLRRAADGSWHGRWLVFERMPVILHPLS